MSNRRRAHRRVQPVTGRWYRDTDGWCFEGGATDLPIQPSNEQPIAWEVRVWEDALVVSYGSFATQHEAEAFMATLRDAMCDAGCCPHNDSLRDLFVEPVWAARVEVAIEHGWCPPSNPDSTCRDQ